MSKQLIIRKSDRAIFEPSFPDSMEAPLRSRPDTERFIESMMSMSGYYFRQLVPVKRSFWFGLKLVRSGAIWETNDESLFDVVERSEVMAGLKLL